MTTEIAREKGKKNAPQQQQPASSQYVAPLSQPAKTAEDYISLETEAPAEEEVKPKKEKKEKKHKKEKKEVVEKEETEEAEEEAPVKKEKREKKKKEREVKGEEDVTPVKEEEKPIPPAPVVKNEVVKASPAKKQQEQPKKQQPKAAAAAAATTHQALIDDGPNFAAAEPKIGADGHVQSDRNARRRMHREFLRQVEQRKNTEAKTEEKSIVMYGLGADVTKKHIVKKVKKIGKALSVELKEEEKTGKKFAIVQFEKLADVQTAIAKLDHHIFKGAMLKVKCLAKSGGVANDAKENEGLRLIVRNLHFDTTDSDLEKAFEVHGPLFEARVVRMPVEDPDNAAPDALGRSRGFGFVQFRDINDARAAVEKLNGVKIKGREMIVDFALAKSKYLEQQKTQKSMEVNPDEDDDDEDDEGAEGDHDDELEMASGDEATDDEGDDDDEDEENENEDEDEKPKVDTDAQRYRTIFIRNLSFQTMEEGLNRFFATFGPVEYARIVYDYGSGLSKGVGFVRFKDADVADRVLARGQLAAEREEQQKSGKKNNHKKKENLFTLSALADGDALMLDGRMLSITRAVAKEDADRLTTENSNERKKKDKRNMYLAYEGTINVNKMSEEELMLPKMDIEKRRRAIREKKEKLKNPMYFVSPVRLSVRNIASTVDDRKLKEIFRDAAIAGMREKNVDRAEVKLELLPKSDAVPVKVKMAKIVRDTEAVKTDGKEARSRGYGFVEFAEHIHALAALRKVNNNPVFTHFAAGGSKFDKKGDALAENERSRLIVEFALENHGKLKLREKRQQDAEKRREEERALREAQGGAGDDKVEKKSRGQRQREAKKQRALEKEQGNAEEEGAGDVADGTKKPKKDATAAKKQKKEVIVAAKKLSSKRKRDDDVAPPPTTTAAKKSKKAKAAPSRKDRKLAKEMAVEESFDALVRNYKREIFGDKPAKGASASGGDAAAESRERWFE